MILHILNPRQKNACTQDLLCALVAFLNIHCFPKLCGLHRSGVVHICPPVQPSLYISIFYPAGWLFGNLSLPLLFGLRHIIAIVFAVLIDIKIESFFTVEMTTSIFCICHTFHVSKYFFYFIFTAI